MRFFKKIKNILRTLLKLPLIASIRATLRFGKLVVVKKDNDNDYSYKWQNEGAVSFSHAYHPKTNHELLDVQLYDYNPSPNDTALIVGTADGAEVPYFCYGVKKVISIEPTPNCIRRLKKLRKFLNLSNLTIFEVAAGKTSKKIKLLLDNNTDTCNRVSSNKIEKNVKEIIVQVDTLTNILKKQAINEIEYCKINIEGEEINALHGIDLNQIKIRKFCISAHDFMGPSTRTYDQVYSWLKKNDYSIKKFEPELLDMFFKNYYIYGTKS